MSDCVRKHRTGALHSRRFVTASGGSIPLRSIRDPRLTLHACLGLVAQQDERFFRDLTANQIRRDVFQYLEQLITAIGDYIDHHNANPKPFIWAAKASDILEKVTRARAALHK